MARIFTIGLSVRFLIGTSSIYFVYISCNSMIRRKINYSFRIIWVTIVFINNWISGLINCRISTGPLRSTTCEIHFNILRHSESIIEFFYSVVCFIFLRVTALGRFVFLFQYFENLVRLWDLFSRFFEVYQCLFIMRVLIIHLIVIYSLFPKPIWLFTHQIEHRVIQLICTDNVKYL